MRGVPDQKVLTSTIKYMNVRSKKAIPASAKMNESDLKQLQ